MKNRVFRCALALVPAVVAAQQASDGARPIALAEAVRLAQQNQPTTVAARNAIRSGESSVRQTKLNFLPTLSLSYSAGQQGGTQFVQGTPVAFSGLPWSYNRGLNSSMTLFDGGRKYYQYRSSEANLDASSANEVLQRFNVALSVKQQYFAILAARETEAAARRQLDQAQQNLKVAAAKMEAGAATRADSLSAAVQVGNAKLAILNSRNSVQNANAALTRLVASPVTVTAVESDSAETSRVEIDEASLASLVMQGPAIRQSDAALAAAKVTHRSAATDYYPQLSATASYGQNPKGTENFSWGGGPASTSTSLRFSMSYNIFNGYQREQQLMAARITEDNAEATLRDQRFLAQQNLSTQLNTYRTAQQRIELQHLIIQQADEALRVVQQRYNLGTAQLLEVLTAQTTLDNARAALIQARLDARTAKANIEALIGRDLP